MKLRVPAHSSQITLDKYIRFKNETDDLLRAAIAISKPVSFVRKLKPETIRTIIRLFDEVLDKGEGVRPGTFWVRVGWKRLKLGFIPDLDDITVGEWGDSDQFQTEIFDNKVFVNVDKFVGILFRPVKREFWGQYDLEPYDYNRIKRYQPFLLKITMDKIFGAMSFFLLISDELLRRTRESLIQDLRTQNKEIEKLLKD